jgi:hypothetical protein
MEKNRKSNDSRPKRLLIVTPKERFIGYHLFGDFQCVPSTDRPSERFVLRYVIENPDQTIAREKVQRELQLIKALIESGSIDPDYVYEYQGLTLDAEYEVVWPDCSQSEICSVRKIRILDGNSISDDELQDIFAKKYDLLED